MTTTASAFTTSQRIQRKRAKGWRMPEGAVYVGRPTKWGNPYVVRPVDRHGHYPFGWRVRPEPSVALHRHIWLTEAAAAERAAHLFRRWIGESITRTEDATYELAGRDLVCWCPLDQPCHADVLLELANQAVTTGARGP